jgi:hypothetical protein
MIFALSIIFFFLDSHYLRKEGIEIEPQKGKVKLGIEGIFNLGLIIGVIISVLISGFWKPHISFEVYSGVHLELQNPLKHRYYHTNNKAKIKNTLNA